MPIPIGKACHVLAETKKSRSVSAACWNGCSRFGCSPGMNTTGDARVLETIYFCREWYREHCDALSDIVDEFHVLEVLREDMWTVLSRLISNNSEGCPRSVRIRGM